MEQPITPPSGGAPGVPSPVPAAPPAKPTGVSYLRGFLGALLGALVGAIPWFIVSTFFNFFVGWLGFLVGLASFFGYKLFKGAKSLPFAMVSIIVLSILAICAAEFTGYAVSMYQALAEVAADYGAVLSSGELLSLTFESTSEWIFSSEMIGSVVGNLIIGLVIAVLGIVAVRHQIFAYTQEGMPLNPAAGGVPAAGAYVPPPYAGGQAPAEAPMNGAVPAETPAAVPPVQATVAAAAPVPAASSAIPTATAGVSSVDGGVPPVPPAPSVAPYADAAADPAENAPDDRA